MKNIVQVLYSGLGGQASVAFSLASADILHEYKYSFIFYGMEPLKKEYAHTCEVNRSVYKAILKKKGMDIVSVFRYLQYLRKLSPSVILLHSTNLIIPSWVYSWLYRTKIVVVEHDPNVIKTKMQWMSSWISQRVAYRVVYLSEDYLREIQEHLPVRMQKTVVIPNGIDTGVFKPATNKIPGRMLVIGMAGRVIAQKDQVTLLKAVGVLLQEHPHLQLHCRIAGEGGQLVPLQQMAADTGIEKYMEFTGYLNETQLTAFYNSLDIYVHTSLSETLSTSILQAMACRVPIVATNIAGISNLLEHEVEALLFDPGDHRQLAGLILYLKGDQGKRAQLAEHALDKLNRKYTHLTMLENYKRVFSVSNS